MWPAPRSRCRHDQPLRSPVSPPSHCPQWEQLLSCLLTCDVASFWTSYQWRRSADMLFISGFLKSALSLWDLSTLRVIEICSFYYWITVHSMCTQWLTHHADGTKGSRAVRITLWLMFMHTSFGEHMGTFLLGLCPRVERNAGPWDMCVWPTWIGYPKPFSTAIVQLTLPPAM